MKRLLAALMLLSLCATLLVGCDHTEEENSMFVAVEKGWSHLVVYHKETKVMYIVSTNKVCTLMVNPDGSPQLWEE